MSTRLGWFSLPTSTQRLPSDSVITWASGSIVCNIPLESCVMSTSRRSMVAGASGFWFSIANVVTGREFG